MRRWILFALAALASARICAADEVLRFYHSDIEVQTNGELRVTETIRVRAEGQEIKRGIYRDFPQIYRGKWGLRQRTSFEVESILRDGRPEPWHGERRQNGRRIYIGDASVFLTPGEYTYTLTYHTDRQLGFFADHDELYWNVTGNGWSFPMEQVAADVTLPSGVGITSREAYTGPFGAKGRDYSVSAPAPNRAAFSVSRPLAKAEGLTIVLTWAKGAIVPAVRSGDWLVIARDNPGLAMGALGLILVLAYYLIVWSAFGVDPAKGTIIPLYGPPDGFSPAAVRVMTRMGFDTKAFAANLINLAVKGALYLKGDGGEFSVQRNTAPLKKPLLPDEEILSGALFKSFDSLSFKTGNHLRISTAQSALRKTLLARLERTYFVKNLKFWVIGLLFSLAPIVVSCLDTDDGPGTLFITFWLSIWTLGVTALVSATVSQFRGGTFASGIFLAFFSIPFLIGEFVGLGVLVSSTSPWVVGLFAAGLLINGIFYHALKAPTRLGRQVLDQIEGFKLYLGVAEKDRLAFENPPEMTPELFDRFLPYALALNVEQRWAERFADVLERAGRDAAEYSPTWYVGSALTAATMGTFASTVGNSLAGAISSSSQAPGSSSGSSSGGGGGGSSGGGGGGGGGGGW